jgi:hypothetical protein
MKKSPGSGPDSDLSAARAEDSGKGSLPGTPDLMGARRVLAAIM